MSIKSCVCTGPLSLANAISHFGSKITFASNKLDHLLQSDTSVTKGRAYWCAAPDSWLRGLYLPYLQTEKEMKKFNNEKHTSLSL